MRPLSAPYRIHQARTANPPARKPGLAELLLSMVIAICKVVLILMALALVSGLPRPVATLVWTAVALAVWRACIYILHLRGWVIRRRT
jgi:hypothetical protein